MGDRIEVRLACERCSARNYRTTRKPTQIGQIKLKKFCATCNAHTVHAEAK
jgi:large subunit ribosomal protein L33